MSIPGFGLTGIATGVAPAVSTSENEFSNAFSNAFDAYAGTVVANGVCYPDGADWSCAFSDADLDDILLDEVASARYDRANALAWSTLSALLGYRLSLCPSILRPCLKGCSRRTWSIAPVSADGVFTPYISEGLWYNGCGCKTDCSCTSLCEVVMPTPVGGIVSVSVDGATLSPSAYRVDNGNRLVRQDGGCWPSCQDMSAPAGDPDTFVVAYYPFLAPNELMQYAAGVLAVEYFKACNGSDCRLPGGVTNITRAGVSMQIEAGSFPGGMTGIQEVDAVIRIYNPNMLKSPPRVLSPDSPNRRARTQTWG